MSKYYIAVIGTGKTTTLRQHLYELAKDARIEVPEAEFEKVIKEIKNERKTKYGKH